MRIPVPSLLLLSGLGACATVAPVDIPEDPGALARIAVIGASTSAGFGIEVDLAEALEEAITIAHDPVADLATELTFLDPRGFGTTMVEQALAHEPTLVVAFDFAFWFGYGLQVESERMARLDEGLAMLDRFDGPLLVAGIPDMHFAIGPMLQAELVPEPATIRALDARVRAWAAARPHVVFLDLAGTIDRIVAGETIELGGGPWPADGASPLQPDRLHPNEEGLVQVTLEALAALQAHGTIAGGYDPDPQRLLEALEARADAKVE